MDKIFCKSFFLAAGLCLTLATPVYAQKAPLYDSEGEPYTEKYYIKQPSGISVALVRKEGLAPDQFVIRLVSEPAVTGCMKLGPLAHETTFHDVYMDITVTGYLMDMRDMPAHPHYECNTAAQQPQAEIVMSKKTLADNGTQHIRFKTGHVTDYYDIRMTDAFVQLVPAKTEFPGTMRYKPQKLSQVINPLKYWFYPEETVVLYVPDATKDDAIGQGLDSVAMRYGMTRLDSSWPEFKTPVRTPHHYYYLDQSKQFTGPAMVASGTHIGNVSIDTTVYKLDGDEKGVRDVAVFMRHPGMHD